MKPKYSVEQKYLNQLLKEGNRFYVGVILEVSELSEYDDYYKMIVLNSHAKKKETYVLKEQFHPEKYHRGKVVLYYVSRVPKCIDAKLKPEIYMFREKKIRLLLKGLFQELQGRKETEGINYLSSLIASFKILSQDEQQLFISSFIDGLIDKGHPAYVFDTNFMNIH